MLIEDCTSWQAPSDENAWLERHALAQSPRRGGFELEHALDPDGNPVLLLERRSGPS